MRHKRIISLNIMGIFSVICLIATSVFSFYDTYGSASAAVGFISFTFAIYGCALLAHINAEYETSKESVKSHIDKTWTKREI